MNINGPLILSTAQLEKAAVRTSTGDVSLCTMSIASALCLLKYSWQRFLMSRVQVGSFSVEKLLKFVHDITQLFKTSKARNDGRRSHELHHVLAVESYCLWNWADVEWSPNDSVIVVWYSFLGLSSWMRRWMFTGLYKDVKSESCQPWWCDQMSAWSY